MKDSVQFFFLQLKGSFGDKSLQTPALNKDLDVKSVKDYD